MERMRKKNSKVQQYSYSSSLSFLDCNKNKLGIIKWFGWRFEDDIGWSMKGKTSGDWFPTDDGGRGECYCISQLIWAENVGGFFPLAIVFISALLSKNIQALMFSCTRQTAIIGARLARFYSAETAAGKLNSV